MNRQVGRRFRGNWRWAAFALAAALALLLVLWLVVLRPWPFGGPPDSLQARLNSAVTALDDYHDRIEAALRLQFLEAALVDGRRSPGLRVDYRLLEEQLEPIIARMEPEAAAALEAELTGLLPDLSRDRSAAAGRLVEMQELLLPMAGLERQGDFR